MTPPSNIFYKLYFLPLKENSKQRGEQNEFMNFVSQKNITSRFFFYAQMISFHVFHTTLIIPKICLVSVKIGLYAFLLEIQSF